MTSSSSSIKRLIDPAIVLAVITAVLYFWGYVYYSAYCEALGANFSGLEVPFPKYLVIGWQNILYIALALCLLLCYVEFLLWLLGVIAKAILIPLFKKWPKFFEKILGSNLFDSLPEGRLNRQGIMLTAGIGISFWGAHDLVKKGQEHANKAIAARSPVIIRDTNHEPVEGIHIYLGNFSGDLVIGEVQEGQEKPDIRIFKEGSYSSYTFRQLQKEKPVDK